MTPSSSPSTAAGRIVRKLVGPYAQNATATFTATPAKGHVFVDRLLDGEPYDGDEDHEGCTAVHFDESGHTLTVVFAPK